MNQLIDTTKPQKPLSAKRHLNRSAVKIFIGLNFLTLLTFGWVSCGNKDKSPSATTQVTTEQTSSVPPTASAPQTTSAPSTTSVANGKNADQLKTAQAPQSPLHKLLDSLNKAGQPQWKLTYLDSVARKNPKITMPQLKHVLDSLGKVKRGFIKK